MLRFYRDTCPLVRRAMRLAGIDPASARAMREVEEKLAAFADWVLVTELLSMSRCRLVKRSR